MRPPRKVRMMRPGVPAGGGGGQGSSPGRAGLSCASTFPGRNGPEGVSLALAAAASGFPSSTPPPPQSSLSHLNFFRLPSDFWVLLPCAVPRGRKALPPSQHSDLTEPSGSLRPLGLSSCCGLVPTMSHLPVQHVLGARPGALGAPCPGRLSTHAWEPPLATQCRL